MMLATAPLVAETFTVSNLTNSGAGSLRQAMLDAEASAGADTIDFTPSLHGTVAVTSSLPTLTGSVRILGPDADLLAVDLTAAGEILFSPGSASPQTFLLRGLSLVGDGVHAFGAGNVATLEDCEVRSFSELGAALVTSGATMVLKRSRVSGASLGSAISNGGRLEVESSTLSDNASQVAGAAVYSTGELIVRDSVLRDNYSTSVGGAIVATGALSISDSLLIGNSAHEGGALHLGAGAEAHVVRSAFVANRALGSGGGAIAAIDADLELADVTLDANSAASDGGAVAFADLDETPNRLQLYGTTITGNTASDGGGLWLDGAASIETVANSALALNGGGDCSLDLEAAGGHNLDSDGSCGFVGVGDHPAVADPLLAPLAWAGGLTPGRLPLPGSPLVGAGSPLACSVTDQRGFPRGVSSCDIGALELALPALLVLAPEDASGPIQAGPRNEARSRIEVQGAPAGGFGARVRYAATATAGLSISDPESSNSTSFDGDVQLRLAMLAEAGEPWEVPLGLELHFDLQGEGALDLSPERALFGPVSLIPGIELGMAFDVMPVLPLAAAARSGVWRIPGDFEWTASFRGTGAGSLQQMSLRFAVPLLVEVDRRGSARESASILMGLPGSLAAFRTDDYPVSVRGVSQGGLFVGIELAERPLFADGFESGDVSEWTQSQP